MSVHWTLSYQLCSWPLASLSKQRLFSSEIGPLERLESTLHNILLSSLSTARISPAFWATVLLMTLGILHASQMLTVQQGAPAQARLLLSFPCMSHTTASKHTHTYTIVRKRLLGRRLGSFFFADQTLSPICSLQSSKVNANFPFIIRVCGWAVCGGKNECSP